MTRLRIPACLTVLFAIAGRAQADDEAATLLLESRCVECHHKASSKGGLDLSTRDALFRGGETGPAIVPGDPQKSLLWLLAARKQKPFMPHKRDPLPDADLETLTTWIRAGALYPRELRPPAATPKAPGFSISEADRNHWAFRPLPPPDRRTSVDAFLDEKLREAGVVPAPAASRETLVRRATLDLTGLPPTPAEIDAFIQDREPGAWDRVLDRLLASPRYGERWGRHWLDLARFAETDGFEHDAVRPHSWRYRDYVIRSFNADKPYDRFVREQVAGDLLWPGDPDALIATGFNLLGPDMVDSSDQIQRRQLTLSDMTDTTALVFLGLTLGCARCHDHKFEPLAQRDYYRLLAFFASAAFRRETPVPTAAERAACEEGQKAYQTIPQVRELAALEAGARDKVRRRKLSRVSPEARMAVETPPEQRDTEQANLALETEPLLEVSEKELADALTPEERARRKALLEGAEKLPKPPPLPHAMTLGSGKPVTTHILFRGEYSQPGEEVAPGFPQVLGGATPAPSRGALADWLATQPLSARVMVNRIWQQHFGRGLVSTPSEFGPHGQPPSHPELLDWLAGEFVRNEYGIKAMHRLLMRSAAYQRSVGPGSPKDPENHLFGRMNRRRLEGEVIRDSLLAVSGRLNLAMGGPGVFPPIPSDVLKGSRGWTVTPDPKEHLRRSVYIFSRRNLRFPFLEVFDAPDGNLSCPERGRSTTAPQSLTLLNAEEVMAAARATAQRLSGETKNPAEQVTLLYRAALGRKPAEAEAALAIDFLKSSPLSELCRAVFNLNAFVYLE
ncbi:MAG TPA: PSD1 and planctomycete cytochrome C domain-containing protein [Planctomycetota bacterium]|nr:PSD1 and planctomycete cytochrome C domain-containing protein [Planctomycetota bacterium]